MKEQDIVSLGACIEDVRHVQVATASLNLKVSAVLRQDVPVVLEQSETQYAWCLHNDCICHTVSNVFRPVRPPSGCPHE